MPVIAAILIVAAAVGFLWCIRVVHRGGRPAEQSGPPRTGAPDRNRPVVPHQAPAPAVESTVTRYDDGRTLDSGSWSIRMSIAEWTDAARFVHSTLADLRSRERLPMSSAEQQRLGRQIAEFWSAECYLNALEPKVRANEFTWGIPGSRPR